MFKIKFTSYIYYLEITRKDLVFTRKLSRNNEQDLVITRKDHVITRKLSRNYEKRSRNNEKIKS